MRFSWRCRQGFHTWLCEPGPDTAESTVILVARAFAGTPHVLFSCSSTLRRFCSRLSRQRQNDPVRVLKSATATLGLWFPASEATSAGHLVVSFVKGLMVSERRFPEASILGASFAIPSANHPFSVPPTGPELADGLRCGQCTRWQIQYVQTTRWQIQYVQTGFYSWGVAFTRRRGVNVAGCCGSGSPLCLDVVASIPDCSDVSTSLFLVSQHCSKLAPQILYRRQLDGETIANERKHTCCLHLRHQVVLRVSS